jgi:hypothetical protein
MATCILGFGFIFFLVSAVPGFVSERVIKAVIVRIKTAAIADRIFINKFF